MHINPKRLRKMALYLKYIAFLMEQDAEQAEKWAASKAKSTRTKPHKRKVK